MGSVTPEASVGAMAEAAGAAPGGASAEASAPTGDAAADAGGAVAERGAAPNGGASAGAAAAAARAAARGDALGPGGEALTASSARRLRKQQKRLETAEASREKRREKKRASRNRKADARKAVLQAMSPEEREAHAKRVKAQVTQRRLDDQASLQRAYESGRPRVVINCSFSGTMNGKERSSLAKQAQMAFVAVRDMRSPIQLHFTSMGPENPAHPQLEAIGAFSWTVHRHEGCVWDLFDASQLVVLTPDAEQDLEEVEEDKVYVIGGIVDRTVCKRQSYDQAVDHGAACFRKLPIKAHGPYGAHPILNIDTVVNILAEWWRRRGDWPGVLEQCLPLRRQAREDTKAVRRERNRLKKQLAGGAADMEESGSSDASSGSSDSESPGGTPSPQCAGLTSAREP